MATSPSLIGDWYKNYTAPTTASSGYTAAQAGAPAAWDVTENQTVAGQTNALIGQDSPLMQRPIPAEERAQRQTIRELQAPEQDSSGVENDAPTD